MAAMVREIELLAVKPRYVIVNKPSGIQCYGTRNYRQFLQPQLYKHLKQHFTQHAISSKKTPKLDPSEFKIIQRLDKYTSGGLVVARGDYAKTLSAALAGRPSSVQLVRRYIGILPVSCQQKPWARLELTETAHGWKGHIKNDIHALARDYGSGGSRPLISYSAHTKFNLIDMPVYPSKAQKRHYPGLFQNKTLYPVVFELVTGRKNQIRDHVLQAFNTTLLNDDKFSLFKMASAVRDSSSNPNSDLYWCNQIGLHSGYVQVGGESYTIPVPECDRELWSGFHVSGNFNEPILNSLRFGW